MTLANVKHTKIYFRRNFVPSTFKNTLVEDK